MRSAREVLVLAVLLSICVTSSFTYTLRKREPWPDTQQLEEALKVIQERRRLIDDEPIGYGDLDFEEEEEEDPMSWDRAEAMREGYIDPDTLEYIRDMIYGTEDRVDSDRWMDEVAPSIDETPSSNVDLNEISDIMSEDEEEREEDKRIPPNMHKKEYDPSSIPEKKEISGGEIESDKSTENEIKEIMEEEAEDAMNESLDKQQDKNEQQEGQEAVTDEELEDVLGGDEEEPGEEDDELFPDMIAREVDLNKERYDDSLPGFISVKRKRSDYIPSIGDEEAKEAEEKLEEQKEIEPEDNDSDSAREYIKQFLALEDDENTNLANALNLATLAQVKKSDKYILEEADYIKRAIEDEQAIQMLKDDISQDVKDEDRKRSDPVAVQGVYEEEIEETDPELEEAIEEEEKEALHDYMTAKLRQYLLRTGSSIPIAYPENDNDIPEYQDSMGKWLDGPVSTDEEGITEEDIALNPFLRELMERYYSGGLSKRAPPVFEEEYEPEEDEDDDDVDEAVKAEIATVLKSYVEDMSPQQRMILKEAVREKLQELEEEEEMQNEIEEEEGYCPALDVLDDCAAAREAGLHLDMEALYMCNRHQMCYTCGSSHGISVTQCDKGYRSEANRLCDKERYPDQCRQDSDVLLLDMIEEHVWVPFSEAPPVCSERCAAEYILGIEDKKK